LTDAQNLIAKGAQFAAGSILTVTQAQLSSILDNSAGDPAVIALKASGFTQIAMSGATAAQPIAITTALADTIANIGGLTVSGSVISANGFCSA
jgi:hypothetical protein